MRVGSISHFPAMTECAIMCFHDTKAARIGG